MNLRAEILREHSKSNTLYIADWIGDNPQRLDELARLLIEDEFCVAQRAAWILNAVAESYPELVVPYLARLIVRAQEPEVPPAVRRNLVRMLQFVPIPVELHGAVMNVCFDWLADPRENVAIRCFSMTVLEQLARIYPEICPELRWLIQDEFDREPTAGYRARARKVLGRLALEGTVNN